MKSYKHNTGFTLMEMIIVIAIIALLATMVIGIAARIDNQGKERLMVETFDLLDAALEAFADYGYAYELSRFSGDKRDFYAGLKFPLDCNDFQKQKLENTLGDALGVSVLVTAGDHDPNYSGSEALYFLLNKVPSCRAMLDKIHRPDRGGIVKPLITNKDAGGGDLQITVDSEEYPLLRIVDPWGKTLRYDYYDEDGSLKDMKESKRSFPLITSAGPDGIFGNSDDITNR